MSSNHRLLLANFRTNCQHLLEEIRGAKQGDPLAEAAVLLPNTSAIQQLRSDLGSTVGVHFYQFYTLGQAVLQAGMVPLQRISDAGVRFLIHNILAEMTQAGALTSFAPLVQKLGFIEVLLGWLREMKSQGIHPEAYAAQAYTHPTERDRQLADFYQRYQAQLTYVGLADPDGILWVAAEALEADPGLFQRDYPLHVLGHDQFTPIELRILEGLSTRFLHLNLYLSWDTDRIPESLALSRLNSTRRALNQSFAFEEVYLPMLSPPNPALAALQKALFEEVVDTIKAGPGLQLIEAPSRESEVTTALRAVKKLLLAEVPPDTIAILAPDPGVYRSMVTTVGGAYGLPFDCPSPLVTQPLVMDLINLLQLSPEFSWRRVFQALRSPYLSQPWLSTEQIDLLDSLSRAQPVLEGQAQWLAALTPIAETFPDLEDEDIGSPPLLSTLAPEEILALKDGLGAFFEHLTPLPQATYQAYTWWVQTALLGVFPAVDRPDEIVMAEGRCSLNLLSGCETSPMPAVDMAALKALLSALRDMLSAHQQANLSPEVSWESFRLAFISHLGARQLDLGPRQRSVYFGPLAEGRVRLVDHLFILGFSEGEFPSQPPPDVFYAPQERERFPLPLRQFLPADDASLFWQVISSAGKSLTLLRPYIDENGTPWQPSPYWDSVQVFFEDLAVEKIPIADPLPPEAAASYTELLVALAQQDALSVPGELQPHYRYARAAESIHAQRSSYNPPGIFEGILQADELLRRLQSSYSEGYVWSASRLNTYASCPFNFFAETLLGLQARKTPEDGLDAKQWGTLLHRLLEKTFAQLVERGVPLDPEHLDQVLASFEAACKQVFPSAPLQDGFRPGPMWAYEQAEQRRMLQAYLTWECQDNPQAFQPYRQEVRFGIPEADFGQLPVRLEGRQFNLCGVIDRMDRDPEGFLRVIDYKSGSSTYSVKTDVAQGLALQTPLYALAANYFWNDQSAGVRQSEFRHIASRKTSGALSFTTPVDEDAVVRLAVRCAFENIERIRGGFFPSATNRAITGRNACTAYCDVAALCRVSRQSILKARKAGLV